VYGLTELKREEVGAYVCVCVCAHARVCVCVCVCAYVRMLTLVRASKCLDSFLPAPNTVSACLVCTELKQNVSVRP
jgi:hypothetical protein